MQHPKLTDTAYDHNKRSLFQYEMSLDPARDPCMVGKWGMAYGVLSAQCPGTCMDDKGTQRKSYSYKNMMTPYDELCVTRWGCGPDKQLRQSHSGEPSKIFADKLRSFGVAYRDVIPEALVSALTLHQDSHPVALDRPPER